MTPHAEPVKELRSMAELLISQADVLYSAVSIKSYNDLKEAKEGAATMLKAALSGCIHPPGTK